MADPQKINNLKDPLLWNPDGNVSAFGKTSTFKQSSTEGVATDQSYSTLSYPAELGSDRFPFFMMIYVNASTKSKLLKSGTGQSMTTDTTQRKVNNSISSAANNTEQARLAAINSESNVKEKLADATQSVSTLVGFEPVKKRLKTAVALPMPRELHFGSEASYKEASGAGFLGSMMNDASSGDFAGVARAGVEGVIQAAGAGLKGLVNKFTPVSTPQDIGGIMMKQRGFAQNDRREQLFEGIGIRSFTFSWEFFPRSKSESETIHNLIKYLRFHMHPEIDDASGGLNFIIPDEFDIEFHHYDLGEIGNDANLGLPKITTCVLSSVQFNGSPLGEYIAFDGTSHPIGIGLQLTFKEIEPLTRKEIGLGY